MKLLSVITFLLFCTLTLWGDAVVVIKGKARRSSLKLTERSGIPCRVRRYNAATEVALRARKKVQDVKLTFKVTGDDEYTFTLGGGYTRKEGDKKDEFEWIDCTLFKVNGKEFIGPNAGKEGTKSETLSRPKAVKGSVKVKKGDTLKLELSLRSTPRKEARKREAEGSMSKRQKERMKREEAKDKQRALEREKEEKSRKETAAANQALLEKRLGKNKSKGQSAASSSAKTSAPAEQQPAASADAEESDE